MRSFVTRLVAVCLALAGLGGLSACGLVDLGSQPSVGQLQGKYLMTLDWQAIVDTIEVVLNNDESIDGYFMQFRGSQVVISEKRDADPSQSQVCAGTYSLTPDNVLRVNLTSGYLAELSGGLTGSVDGDTIDLMDDSGGDLVHMKFVAESAANKGTKLSGMYGLDQMLDNQGNDITGSFHSYIAFTWSTFRYVTDPLDANEQDYQGLYSVAGATVTFRFSDQGNTETGQLGDGKLVIQESDDRLIFVKYGGV